ncbi:MAG: DUF2284 domain-containing protein [Candidatus Omnitrophica bacterium]|nr:DUF2284 domain-containing protein [Candidatus Omnitrophota bacterium]
MSSLYVEKTNIRRLINKVIELSATRAHVIYSQYIPLTWKAVMLCLDCKVAQVPWMKRWSCPPYTINVEDVKAMTRQYPYALIVNVEAPFPFFVKASWHTWNPFLHVTQKIYSHIFWSKLHTIMVGIKKYFGEESISSYCWGSAPCHGCFKCSFPQKCRKPDSFLYSPEASGIDLYRIAQKIGIPVEIPPQKKIQLMSLALFDMP